MKAYIKREKSIKFGDIEIKNQKFPQHKESISIKNIDINKIVRSNKVSFGKKGFKTFIGYKYAKTLDLYVYIPPKWLQIRKDFDKTKFMSSLIKDDELLEKYSEIWDITAKIKSYNPMEKSTQISGTIKNQKKIIELFPYH